MSFNTDYSIARLDLNSKRLIENLPCAKRQRTQELDEIAAHILTDLNGRFYCNASKAGCKNKSALKSYSELHLHASQHNPEIGLVVIGFRCNEHHFDTLSRQSLYSHFFNSHKVKVTDEDCKKLKVKVIFKEDGWFLCPKETPLFTKRQVIQMYVRSHGLGDADLQELLKRHVRQLDQPYDPLYREGSLFVTE